MTDIKKSIQELRKKFGDEIIRTGDEIPDIRRIPLKEMPMFDYVSGGGLMHNRINEFVGENGSTKSWVMYKYIGIYQHMEWTTHTMDAIGKIEYNKDKTIKGFKLKRGKSIPNAVARQACLIDIEHTYTPEWGRKLGIDTAGLLISQPDRLTTAVDVAEMMCADPTISLVCIDSLSAVGTDEEIDNSMESNQMGVAARFWNKAIRKLQSAMNRNPNGGQLKRSKSLSVKFRGLKPLVEKIDGKEVAIGRNVVLKCLKNKGGGTLGRTGNFFYAYVDYDVSIANSTDIMYQIIELGVREGIINRFGNSYHFDSSQGECKGVGMGGFAKKITQKGVFEELRKKLYNDIINLGK